MDVTNGLISRLVKSKSTERVLAPIASQVSLLMILNEVQGDESADGSALNVSACVERVTQAVDGFIRVGQDQIHHSSDPLFDSQMSAACETLELAKTELYVAGQSINGTSANSHAHTALINAAKDVLQAVLRVLVVVDDVEVRRCAQAVSAVEAKVRNVGCVTDSRELVPAFKELTEAILYMTMLVSRRQKDLVSSTQSDELMTGLNLMRKGVSSLRMAVQTQLKYPDNPQAMAGKQQVLDKTLSTLADIRSTLESGPPSDLDTEEAGHFVDHIDKVLEGLGEGRRFDLSPDMESWVASIIRHAMGVAHLCQGTYRHLITRTCQRILQSKFRLFELQESMVHSPHLTEIRLDYEGVCEVLLDEFCEVEKHVNMALLNLIIDTCCFTSQPLEQMATAAIHNQDDLGPDVGQSPLVQEFSCHADKLCQVAAMASASSMDPRKVRAVKLATSRLEQLHPEVIPAIGAVARHPGNVAAVRHLKGLVQEWENETEALVRALDSMTDPAVFLHVTEQRMRQGVNVVRGKVASNDEKGSRDGLRKLLAHARRMTQVALRVVDNHCDAVFRNGLMVYVQQMESAKSGVKDASRAALEDLSHTRLVDTLHRRLGLLLDAAADLRQGVKGDNHVDLLNPARQNVRRKHLLSDKPCTGERVADARSAIHDKQDKPAGQAGTHSVADILARVSATSLTATPSAANPQPTTATAAPTTSVAMATKPAGPASEGGGPVGGSGKKRGNSSTSKTRADSPPRGESAAMLQNCGDELVASAMGGDSAGVARWNGDVLGWTAHLGEVALSLLEHCHHAARKSEMRQLTVEVDRLAPLVIEAARFVATGDKSQTSSLRLLVDDWVNACNKLRIVVDVAAGDWLLLMEQISRAVTAQDTDALKSLLSILDRNQREMNQLLGRAKSLEGHHLSRGTEIVQFFRDAHLELDGLTATLKTTADCIAMSGDTNAVNRTQLLQRGREWCVLMTCLVAELDFVADTLSAVGQATLGIPAISATQGGSSVRAYANVHSKVVPLLQAETARLKDVLACLTVGGDGAVKKKCADLTQGLADMMAEVLEIAHTPVDDATLPQAQLFGRLDAGLARSRWTEKALEAEQFVQSRCLKFSALVNNLLFSDYADGTDSLAGDVSQLQAKVKVVTQRALQAIQLSADLQQRATVRRCLDDLTNLLPTITQAATDCASGVDREKRERELQKAATQWGAKVHHLMATLRSMSDVKPSLVNELDRHLSAQPVELATAPPAPPGTQQAAPIIQTPTTLTPITHTPLARKSTPVLHSQGAAAHSGDGRLMATPSSATRLRNSPHRARDQVDSASSGQAMRPATAMSPSFSPSSGQPVRPATAMSPSFSAASGQPVGPATAMSPSFSAASGQPVGPATAMSPSFSAASGQPVRPATAMSPSFSAASGQPVRPVMAMSPYRRSALYTSWLASAQYLGEEVAGWEDKDNHFVQLVHTMAQYCQQMADFSRGGTSLKDSEEVASTGLALAAGGKELETFARCLLAMGPHHRNAGDLRVVADKIATYSNQLRIVASVLQNGPGNPEGDCILARNAANLVEAVRQMFSVSEGMSVAGSLEPREGNETDAQVVDLLTRWQHKLAAYRVQQANIPQVDELGLRRMEIHNPPSLTTLVDG